MAVPDESSLEILAKEAVKRGLHQSCVREPDLDNQMTAIALEPGVAAQKLCAQLPLALRRMPGAIWY